MGDSADLLTKCGRSCFVQLQRLTEEEIAKYTTSSSVDTTEGNLNNLQCNIPTKHSFRNVSRVKSEIFDSYKKSREKFLNRRSRHSSTEMTDFNVFSGDEFSEPSEEEYRNSRAHKRKKLTYEDDLEWSPNTDGKYNLIEKHPITRPRKIGLRVNTRRKRIESNSSSSSDEDSFYYQQSEYQTKSNAEKTFTSNGDILLNKTITSVSSIKKKASDSSNSKISRDSSPLIDTDLLSKIMHEMSDYNMKNSKPGNKSNESEEIEKSNVDNSNAEINHYPPVKKRQSHLFKITDEDVTPRLTSVQQIVRKMVNHVCSSERRRLLAASGWSRRKICKWCDAPISPIISSNNNVDSDLCIKCRSVSKDSKISNKNPNKAKIIGGEINMKLKSGNKIKNKLLKKLPKYDQQRLAYSGQADKSSVSKGYNHCKSFVTPKDLDSSTVAEKTAEIKNSEKVKLKRKAKDSLKKNTKDSVNPPLKSKLNKKKKKLLTTSEKKIDESRLKLKNLVSSAINKAVGEKKQKQVSVTNIDKGLFLMTFPEPHQELEIPPNEINALLVSDKNIEKAVSSVTPENQADLLQNKSKQSVTNNVQYGNYLLPPVPTVVVANYAATDAKSGDYYLSSVYYQNEMTRSKNTPLKNESILTVTTAESLPSMPSLDQLSTVSTSPTFRFPGTSHLHSLPVTDFSLPPNINTSNIFPSACHLTSLPKTDFSLPPSINTSNSVLLQPHVISPTNISISAYSSQDNVNDFKIATEVLSTSYPTSIESEISSILNNPEIQIQNLQPKDSDSDFNLFDNQELDLTDSYEDNSNLTAENCTEDLGVIINNSVNENLQNSSFDHSLNSEMPAKQSDKNESIETDDNKLSEQNADFSQSSTVDGNISEGSFFYQPEAETLFSEASIDDCFAELDAFCILSLIDLEINPKWKLKRKIDFNKNEIEKVKSVETQDSATQAKLRNLESHDRTLQLANLLLNKFGTFTKLSDTILRKQRLLQIKKEKGLELEETRSSCQFASSVPPPPILQNESVMTAEKMPSAMEVKMENAPSCDFASQLAEPINHIEKIQTQIQSIQGNSSVAIDPNQLGLVHHFPAPDMPVASNATLSIAPRTEIMNEFRETPSRGSGPRTPARPESAMSQNDDGVMTPQQIKKEQFETISSPLSQCAFSQNATPSPQIPTSTPNTSQIAPVSSLALVSVSNQLVNALGNQRHRAIAPALSINNSSQIQKMVQQHTVASAVSINSNSVQIQKVMQMHQGQIGPPNVTVPFPTGNQNFAKVVVNKPPAPSSVMPNLNNNPSTANVIVRSNYMNVQPVNVPGTTSGHLFQRFVQSSVPAINTNMNSYTYKQTMNSGGTMLVNSIGQNYALANSQVLNQQQVSRVYNTGNVQQPVQVSNSVNQAPPNATYLMPNSKREESTPMTCAVCYKPATLRCKQCAKVAYCDTICAKNYWHQKHKMECKMMLANV